MIYQSLAPPNLAPFPLICAEMRTVRMIESLSRVSHAHPDEFIAMIFDGAISHAAEDLAMAENIGWLAMPADAPALNSREDVSDELWERESLKVCPITQKQPSHNSTAACPTWLRVGFEA